MHVAAQSLRHLEAGALAALSPQSFRVHDDVDDEDYGYYLFTAHHSAYNTNHGEPLAHITHMSTMQTNHIHMCKQSKYATKLSKKTKRKEKSTNNGIQTQKKTGRTAALSRVVGWEGYGEGGGTSVLSVNWARTVGRG